MCFHNVCLRPWIQKTCFWIENIITVSVEINFCSDMICGSATLNSIGWRKNQFSRAYRYTSNQSRQLQDLVLFPMSFNPFWREFKLETHVNDRLRISRLTYTGTSPVHVIQSQADATTIFYLSHATKLDP